jgi:hypothetical protein
MAAALVAGRSRIHAGSSARHGASIAGESWLDPPQLVQIALLSLVFFVGISVLVGLIVFGVSIVAAYGPIGPDLIWVSAR